MASWDRVKKSFFNLAKAADPRAGYGHLYGGTILSQSDDLSEVDMKLDDRRLPGMAGLPLKLGIPGLKIKLRFDRGVPILGAVGFSDSNPALPFALLVSADAPAVERITIPADLLELGGENLTPLQDGVVTGLGVDPLTGLQYWQLGSSSPFVMAKKKQ